MVWTLMPQQQQCGAQVRRPRKDAPRQQEAQQGQTELEQDERGEDAEQVVDPQAEQALNELERNGQDGDQPDEDGRLDRND